MREIRGDAKSIRALLSGAKFSVDYYQREYRWQTKQITELLDDLSEEVLRKLRGRRGTKRRRDIWPLLPRLHHHQ